MCNQSIFLGWTRVRLDLSLRFADRSTYRLGWLALQFGGLFSSRDAERRAWSLRSLAGRRFRLLRASAMPGFVLALDDRLRDEHRRYDHGYNQAGCQHGSETWPHR